MHEYIGPKPVKFTARSLGSAVFRKRLGVEYAYVAGGMYRGVASTELVVCMAKAGFIGFFGTGGLSSEEIERSIETLQARLRHGEPYGMNLLANHVDPSAERRTVELFLRRGVRTIEAAAFMQITLALVLYRVKGLRMGPDGRVVCDHQVIAKVSRPEVAEAFMSPPPAHLLQKLQDEGSISGAQAAWAMHVPMSHDICVEADSGGHTDGGIALTLFPTIARLKVSVCSRYPYHEPTCVGLGGGLGTPEAVAAAFVMGADFVLTGSINQCTVESGAHAKVKALLQDMNVQDTDYAPAGDMFEMGAKVQVLKKGVFFPVRANKLHALYSHCSSLDDIPAKTRETLEQSYFKKSLADVWNETRTYLVSRGLSHEIDKAEENAKHKMALVFRWYFGYSTALAMSGGDDRVNFQVHTGPALGAFNQWVRHTPLEPWENRHVDAIASKLLTEAAAFLQDSLARLSGAAAPVHPPAAARVVSPDVGIARNGHAA